MKKDIFQPSSELGKGRYNERGIQPPFQHKLKTKKGLRFDLGTLKAGTFF
jgi:hypothetical protein